MSTLKRKFALVAAATAAVGATIATGLAGGPSANADPKQYTDPIFGFGSDTVQDVTNAFAGFSNGVNFSPLQTSVATKSKQLVSWDAFPVGAADPTAANCITTRVGSPQILRPNGSGNGQKAISAAFNVGQKWPAAAGICGPTRSMAGIIDFARSSSKPNPVNATGPLVFIPFGRDALTFAYLRPAGGPVTSLSTAQITSLHADGPQLIGTTPVIACGIQTGSGTYGTWMKDLGLATNGTGDPGTNICNNVGSGASLGRVQENNGPDLTAKAALLSTMTHDVCDGILDGVTAACTNAELVVGFSASQWIARSNGVGTPAPALGANGGLGATNGVVAVSGTVPDLLPVAAAYSDATFGRDVYYVLAAETIEGADAVPSLVDMFVGSTSKVCAASATIQKHGFLSLGTGCGDTTLRGNFVAS